MKRRVFLGFVCFLLLLFSMICSSRFFSVEASAETEYRKYSASEMRALLGDTITGTYILSGQPNTCSFNYYGSYTSPSVGMNVDLNSVIPTPVGMAAYDFVIYKCLVPVTNRTIDSVSINDFYLRFTDYARGGVALSTYLNNNYPTSAWNKIADYPDNYCGSFYAPHANEQVSASLADYYGVMYFQFISGYNAFNFRPIYYDYENGGSVDSLKFSGIYPYYSEADHSGVIYLCFICPYIGSGIFDSAEITTTGSGGSQTIINNNVDMSETNSILGSIVSAITNAVQSIINGIQNIFIPSPGFLDDQLAEIQASFAWYDDIKQIGADFSGAMENQANASAPVISIPTLSSRGHVYTARSEMVLDLSDYQESVVSVRAILSVLLWIFFLWRLYCRLPDIIHGSGMIIGDGSRIMDELDNRESQNVNDDVNFHDHHIGR